MLPGPGGLVTLSRMIRVMNNSDPVHTMLVTVALARAPRACHGPAVYIRLRPGPELESDRPPAASDFSASEARRTRTCTYQLECVQPCTLL